MIEPTVIPKRKLPKYGFHTHTEKTNGRWAMIGFVSILILEIIIGHGIMIW